ncbi:MAG: class I SAM-dependent methyltransferase [bacterium]|nr:class I SAM-dependent methyltransferase [bacterium]
MKCKICGKEAGKIFDGKILKKYDIEYFFCPNCEHIQTEEPFWLKEAYADSISDEDTGIMKRNLDNTITAASILTSFYDIEGRFLDFAGGYGIFTRLMRDIGFDFVWDDKFSKNLFARGFEFSTDDKIELITAFEVFEHLAYPMIELKNMFEITGDILFTQKILPIPPLKQDKWWYYAPNTGQHISFYTNKTLDYMAEKFNKKHLFKNDFHLFTSKDISEQEFENAVLNDALIYSRNLSELKSKTSFDMEYIINKKAGLT